LRSRFGAAVIISEALRRALTCRTACRQLSETWFTVQDVPVLVAQNAGGGSIYCTIIVDGHKVAHETSHGQYAVVTCSGS
jgi:hypothetical protein